jgi:3-dehydroquinate dehydratase
MSYLNKVLYHGLNLQAAMNTEDLNQIERCYDKVSYFIAREQEVYGDQAMEDLYDALPEEMMTAIGEANDLLNAEVDRGDDLIDAIERLNEYL